MVNQNKSKTCGRKENKSSEKALYTPLLIKVKVSYDYVLKQRAKFNDDMM